MNAAKNFHVVFEDSAESTTRARLTPGKQMVGIKNLEFIDAVQPRDSIDRGWVNDLSKFNLEGSEFPAARVYQLPDGRLIPAEGFHRSMALLSVGKHDMLCDVVDGTLEDAIVFAAGSNKSNGVKPMSPKDITKAVEMVLMIDIWRKKSDAAIGDHVGCGSTKVRIIRDRLSTRHGWPVLEQIEAIDGKTRLRPSKPSTDGPRIRMYRNRFVTNINGRRVSSSSKEKLEAQIEKSCQSITSKRHALTRDAIRGSLSRMGFAGIGAPPAAFPGIRGFHRPGFVCISCDFSTNETLRLAIADLIASRRYKGDLAARMVVLCYVEDGPAKVIDLYRQEGFEFLSPDELIASLKFPDNPQPENGTE